MNVLLRQSKGRSIKLRGMVQAARDLQAERFARTEITCNAAIPGGAVADYCEFEKEGFDEYKRVLDQTTMTTRTADRLARVARTIGDLERQSKIGRKHIVEAEQLMLKLGQASNR